MEKPKGYKDEYTTYLDTLRNSGITNMLGADEFLTRELKLDKYKAKEFLTYWIDLKKEQNISVNK